jgi:putative transposase
MSDRWPNRRSVRRQGHNYQSTARYFVTICAAERTCIFGQIVDGVSVLNTVGRIVDEE